MTDVSCKATVLQRDRERWRYRMKDVCELTGLPRQAIHFYIQQALLPPGRKTGRNMAWYGDEHVERIRLIQKLQHENFLPLKAIKAILDGQSDAFSPEQHAFLARVRKKLHASFTSSDDRKEIIDAAEVLSRTGVDRDDLDRAVQLGMIAGSAGADGRMRVAAADVWLFELLGQIRRLGFSRQLGFVVDDFAFYDELLSRLFQDEVRLISSRLAEQPPEKVAAMIEAVLPLVHEFMTRQHARIVRDFFANLNQGQDDAQ